MEFKEAFKAMKDGKRCLVPWLASQTDMLADDWCFSEAVAA